MIGRLSGQLIEKQPPHICLNVGGVGYDLDVPMSTYYQLPNLGEDVVLLTHLTIREDAHQLFGFSTQSEREIFRKLIKISGIGSRTALAILSGLSAQDLVQAVAQQETAQLIRIPGIGKKTAERLLLELKDKLDGIAGNTPEVVSSQASHNDIFNALLALGYAEREANATMRQLPPNMSVSDGIKLSLKLLAKS